MRTWLVLLGTLATAACGGSGGGGDDGGSGGTGGEPEVRCETTVECGGGPCLDGVCAKACGAEPDCGAGLTCRIEGARAFCEPAGAGLPLGMDCAPAEVDPCDAGACEAGLDPLCRRLDACFATCGKDVTCRNECQAVETPPCNACYDEWEACADAAGCRGGDGIIDEVCAASCAEFHDRCFVGASTTCSPLCREDADCVPDRACLPGDRAGPGGDPQHFCLPRTCGAPAGDLEMCDGLDDDCDQEVDEGSVCEDDGIRRVALGKFSLSGTCTDIVIEVPEGASSFHLNLGDLAGSRVAACQVLDPSGTRQPLVEAAIESDGTLGLFVPHTPRVPFSTGTWKIGLKISSGPPREVTAEVLIRTGPVPDRGTLKITLFLVGVPGVDAASARSDPDLLAMIERTRIVYAKAGVVLRDDWEVIDITGDEKTRFETIDSFNRHDSEVAQLVALSSRAKDPKAVPVFLVRSIAGFSAAGVSPGIPCPAWMPGTDRSGAVMGVGDDWRLRPTAIGAAVAHEIGHVIGLFHTTEKDGSRSDPIDDTPECPKARDANGDGTLASQECGGAGGDNFMFWGINRYQQSVVTPEQARVIRSSPWVNGKVER